ncbi:MAG: hypothetical protein SWX82_24675 [Cyanobacteriota bacterium]|nr:hypothetical protein [Cyanobacteriota bacterium]
MSNIKVSISCGMLRKQMYEQIQATIKFRRSPISLVTFHSPSRLIIPAKIMS